METSAHISEEEFVEEIEKHERSLRHYAFKLTQDQDDADDLVQSSLIRMWQARDQFKCGTNFKAWGCKITLNQFRTSCRDKKEQLTYASNETESYQNNIVIDPGLQPMSSFTLNSMSHGAEEQYISSEEIERPILDALRSIPDKYRNAFLADLEGYSVKEAARILRCPQGTVASRVHRGCARLKSKLDSIV